MTDSGLTDLNDLADQKNIPRDGTQDLQESTTENEENINTEDGTKAEDNQDTEYTVLINGEKIIFTTDKFGASLVDKLEGHGLHIQQNGDVAIISGSGGKGKACGGRLLINTKNGQLTKSGPIYQEVSASANGPGEKGSKTSEGSGNSEVAYSGSFSGDHETEVQGTKYIKARDIVLDATDTLTIKGTKVIVAADEWIEDTGLQKTKVDTIEEEVTSQRTSEVKEDTSQQYDGRTSQNVVGSGHINETIRGDYQLQVDGIADIQVMARQVAAPLVSRMGNIGLNIGVNGAKYGARLDVSSFIDIRAGHDGNISLSSEKGIHLDTVVRMVDNGVVGTAAAKGEIKIDAADGFNVKAVKEDINIEATTGDISIKSTAKNVKVEAPAGNFDVTALKIYLN